MFACVLRDKERISLEYSVSKSTYGNSVLMNGTHKNMLWCSIWLTVGDRGELAELTRSIL